MRLALANDPVVQALLAESWEAEAEAAERGRLPNPVFGFERLESDEELELTRVLSIGLLDLLTLPWRDRAARDAIELTRLELAASVVDRVSEVREAWVRAVVAAQLAEVTARIAENARASAELARRMESVGNFNRLERLRQQGFHADAVTALADARHGAVAAREALVRALGLDEAQAARLELPERLPELPEAPLEAETIARTAGDARLDVAIARTAVRQSLRGRGHESLTSVLDIELAAIDERVKEDGGERETARGFEIELVLPLFGGPGLVRERLDARGLARARRLEATVRAASSELRESYSAYRTAYDVARHYRDEVVPLREAISEEMQLAYNGMLIGVFELLADARARVEALLAALDAEERYWLADAALQATLIGRSSGLAATAMPTAGGAVAAAGVSRNLMAALPEPVFAETAATAPPIEPDTGRPFDGVVTPNGWSAPWRMRDGVKEFHLVAEPVVREMTAGFEANLWGYNGQSPGPTIEFVEGDRVRIYVTNRLPEHTSIHWHGQRLPSGMDGVSGLTQPPIPSGKTFVWAGSSTPRGPSPTSTKARRCPSRSVRRRPEAARWHRRRGRRRR